MRLFGTPRSHFTRKVRILLDLYAAQYEMVDVGNVGSARAELFADNPLMKVPILEADGIWLVESDHIAGHVVRRFAPSDPHRVFRTDPFGLNARAIMNGAMAEEVKVILAARSGLSTDAPFFDKARETIQKSLAWLEENADGFSEETPGYAEFHLVSMWDHLVRYDTVPRAFDRLEAIASAVGSSEIVRRSAPPPTVA